MALILTATDQDHPPHRLAAALALVLIAADFIVGQFNRATRARVNQNQRVH